MQNTLSNIEGYLAVRPYPETHAFTIPTGLCGFDEEYSIPSLWDMSHDATMLNQLTK